MTTTWLFCLALGLVFSDAFLIGRQKRALTCSQDWNLHESSCYSVQNARITYAEAQQQCGLFGGYVTRIQNEAEFNFVKNLGIRLLETVDAPYWLNGQNVSGVWKWDDGTPMTYTKWAGSEPDYLQGKCLIVGSSQLWKANDCSKPRRFVCEKPATFIPDPVTEAPVTEAPVTEAPVTEAPVTDAPVTDAPVTVHDTFVTTPAFTTYPEPPPTPETIYEPFPFTTEAIAPPETPVIDIFPEFFTTAPEVFTTAPEVFTTAPEVFTTAPEVFTTAPEVFTTAPEVYTTAPEVFTTAPEVFTTAPEVYTTTAEVTKKPTTDIRMTIIFLEKRTYLGQNVFFRGGIDHAHREGCTSDANTSACAIPITHNEINMPEGHVAAYKAWSRGDNHLDWYGSEVGQGSYNGKPAQGTPGVWTTNDVKSAGYHPGNSYGPNYWMLEVQMDCLKTQNGYFEVKGYMDGVWEGNIFGGNQCKNAEPAPFASSNHIALCGAINVFHWNEGRCETYGYAYAG